MKEKFDSALPLAQVSEHEGIPSPTENLQQVQSAINRALELLNGVITRSTAPLEAQGVSSRRSSEDHIRGYISCKSPSFFAKKRRKKGIYKETSSKENEKEGINFFRRGS